MTPRWWRWWQRVSAPGLALKVMALWKLAHHGHTPRGVRWLAFLVLAYALSPLDLVPDFIPLLGQLDDLLIIPLGILLVVRLTPRPLWQECLAQAQAHIGRLPHFFRGVWLVILTWLLLLAALAYWLWGLAASAWGG
ncbi:YkvA family protein [Ideonella livida]|uniref:DUF1232 domain-containing protein n=1 Tax=Ideonella livida TaxID=2707176 RepID=A0A7C9PEU8_9BURK|nr:DUF1232 domain-containing protein [Ideonella livida]NDY89831.1 DUF1232 domain-containing protein [Ideonella livida]